jgi:hypothetical protein
VLVSFARGYYQVEDRKETLLFNGRSARRVDFRIAKGATTDELRIDLELNPQVVEPDGRVFLIVVPDGLKGGQINCSDAEGQGPLPAEPGQAYRFAIKGAQPECNITFSGTLLSTSARELDLDLDVISEPRAAFSVSGQFVNLDKVDVSALSPAPSFQNSSVIQYLPLPSSPLSFTTISMQLRDRQNGAKGDLLIFLVGIFFGVVCSLIASIVYELIRSWERQLGRRQRQCKSL